MTSVRKVAKCQARDDREDPRRAADRLRRAWREPDGALASEVVNRMKELRVLISSDGPHHNVLKIKPRIVFSDADVDGLVDALERSLADT
jgi:4-aminobutyrate aminotransferase-like enzyme